MIFYFTGTGNTRWAARQLAEATNDELHFIPDELNKGDLHYTLKDGERLGFCFPTHGWQPPRIVREFIRKATFTFQTSSVSPQTSYIYALSPRECSMFNVHLRPHHLRRQHGLRHAHLR